MTNKNDITGDTLATKSATDAYREGYDRIFGKKRNPESVIVDEIGKALAEHLDKVLAPDEKFLGRLKGAEETE